MGIETLTQPAFQHTCDRCGKIHNTIGYDNPTGWGRPFTYTQRPDSPWLCDDCIASFEQWVNWLKLRRCPDCGMTDGHSEFCAGFERNDPARVSG